MIMPYTSHCLRCVFVHIPKTGGTSVRKSLLLPDVQDRPATNGHPTPTWFNHNFSYEWNSYFRFCVVRHPLLRFYSAYKFALSEKNYWAEKKGFEHVDRFLVKKLGSVEQVAKFLLHSKNRGVVQLTHQSWKPQSVWYADTNAPISILRLEDIVKGFTSLKKRLRIADEISLKKLNSVEGNDFLSPTTKKIVFEIYKEDYVNLGYTMEI